MLRCWTVGLLTLLGGWACLDSEAPCPPGAMLQGQIYNEQWCEKPGPNGRPVRHGRETRWFANLRKYQVGEHLDGIRQGLWSQWYRSGEPFAEVDYRDGHKHGIEEQWYRNGERKALRTFRHGVLSGPWKRFYETGDLWEAGQYLEGQRHGTWREYYPGERPRLIARYLHGWPCGSWTHWDVQGPPEAPVAVTRDEDHGPCTARDAPPTAERRAPNTAAPGPEAFQLLFK